MKFIFTILILTAFIALAFPQQLSRKPTWVNNPPKNKDYIYGAGKGVSQNMNLATQKADMDARLKIAKATSKIITSFTKKSDVYFKNDIQYFQSIETIRTKVLTTLIGTEIVESNYLLRKDLYTVYILMRIKKTSLKQSFLSEIDADLLMKEKLIKANLYKEIEDKK